MCMFFFSYYTTDPAEACIFVPALDLLSESRVDSSEVASAALHKSSPYWNKGRNHVIITPYPADKVSMSIGEAVILMGTLHGDVVKLIATSSSGAREGSSNLILRRNRLDKKNH